MSNSSLAASSVPNCLISSSAIVFDVKDGVENLSLNPILSITRRATFNSRPVIVKTFLIPPEILVPKDALNTHVPLLVEVKRLSCQRYRKLNGLVGIILETMSVVFEFQPEGSLRDYILNKKPLPWAARFALAIDVADGMSFLVARQSGQLKKEKCTHQHLSSSNILIVVAKGILRAKITDFGTKSLREAFIDFENVSAERYTKVKRTSMSIPPLQKSLAGNNIPKSESGGFFLQRRNSVYCDQTVDRKLGVEHKPVDDVYSFGVVLAELSTWRLADEIMKDLTQHLIVENTPARIVTTIHQCISADIMKRPHFADIGPFLKNEGYMDQYEGLAAVGGNTPVALDRSLRRKSILNSPASNRPEEFRINIRSNRSSSSIHSSESSLASVPRSDIIIQKPSVSYQKERVLTQQQKNMIRKRRRCISFTLSFSVCAIAIIVVLTVLNQAGSNANSTSTATSNSIPNTTDTNTPITSPT